MREGGKSRDISESIIKRRDLVKGKKNGLMRVKETGEQRKTKIRLKLSAQI